MNHLFEVRSELTTEISLWRQCQQNMFLALCNCVAERLHQIARTTLTPADVHLAIASVCLQRCLTQITRPTKCRLIYSWPKWARPFPARVESHVAYFVKVENKYQRFCVTLQENHDKSLKMANYKNYRQAGIWVSCKRNRKREEKTKVGMLTF